MTIIQDEYGIEQENAKKENIKFQFKRMKTKALSLTYYF